MNLKLDYENKQLIILKPINLAVLKNTIMLFPDWEEWTVISKEPDFIGYSQTVNTGNTYTVIDPTKTTTLYPIVTC